MTTPAARAAAAMASTPEDGIMDGDLGQEESHAHLGAQRQGHRRRLDWHLSAATALFGIQAAGALLSGPEAAPSKRVGGSVSEWAGAVRGN